MNLLVSTTKHISSIKSIGKLCLLMVGLYEDLSDMFPLVNLSLYEDIIEGNVLYILHINEMPIISYNKRNTKENTKENITENINIIHPTISDVLLNKIKNTKYYTSILSEFIEHLYKYTKGFPLTHMNYKLNSTTDDYIRDLINADFIIEPGSIVTIYSNFRIPEYKKGTKLKVSFITNLELTEYTRIYDLDIKTRKEDINIQSIDNNIQSIDNNIPSIILNNDIINETKDAYLYGDMFYDGIFNIDSKHHTRIHYTIINKTDEPIIINRGDNVVNIRISFV